MDGHRVLIADDHDEFRRGLEALLAATPDVEVVGTASDGAMAIAKSFYSPAASAALPGERSFPAA